MKFESSHTKLAFCAFVSVIIVAACGKNTADKNLEATTTIPLAATYASLDANIFQGKCYSCHTGPKPAGKDDFSNYDTLIKSHDIQAEDPDNSELCKDVRSGKMPKDGDKLSDAEINAICDWIKNGLPRS